MTNFTKILPCHVAMAMAQDTPGKAVDRLCAVAKHEAQLDCSTVTWSATGLPVRHGLLMEWLAAEMMA